MTKFGLKSLTGERGFTLVELLIYVAIVGIVMGAIYSMFYRQQDSYMVQDRLAILQQNLRGAMTVLANDIQMAGHYTCYEQRAISMDWDDDAGTPDDSIRPILLGTNSEIIIVKVDSESMRPLEIGEFTNAGDPAKTITVDNTFLNGNNKSLDFHATNNPYGVLIKSDLSRAEFFEVTAAGGGTLTVLPAADSLSDTRFVESYFAGATPEQSDLIAPVEIITYTLDGNNRLWRSGEMVAEHISGFQLQYAVVDDVLGEDWVSKSAETALGQKTDNQPWDERDVRRITVTLTGDIQVSPKLGSKQRTLSSTIKVRNLGMDVL
jgi:prepilin-type N-terminal cleavage/methylation domain-containing protein